MNRTDWETSPPPPRVIVVETPGQVDDLEEVPRRRRGTRLHLECPYCGCTAPPVVRRRIGALGWVMFAVLLLFFFPLCFLGLMLTDENDYCYDCGAKLRTRGQAFGFPN